MSTPKKFYLIHLERTTGQMVTGETKSPLEEGESRCREILEKHTNVVRAILMESVKGFERETPPIKEEWIR